VGILVPGLVFYSLFRTQETEGFGSIVTGGVLARE
jgi:hypothetical protein